jgi:ribosomal protein S18 acetylase RimI-like enzyme
MNIRPYRTEDQTAVLDLWERCGLVTPKTRAVAEADLARKLLVQPELFVVGTLASAIIVTGMAGYDGHRGHLYYLAVCPQHQRQGRGREIVTHVQTLLRELGCHRLTLYVSCDNLAVTGFYERLGFERNDVISMGRFTGA